MASVIIACGSCGRVGSSKLAEDGDVRCRTRWPNWRRLGEIRSRMGDLACVPRRQGDRCRSGIEPSRQTHLAADRCSGRLVGFSQGCLDSFAILRVRKLARP